MEGAQAAGDSPLGSSQLGFLAGVGSCRESRHELLVHQVEAVACGTDRGARPAAEASEREVAPQIVLEMPYSALCDAAMPGTDQVNLRTRIVCRNARSSIVQ